MISLTHGDLAALGIGHEPWCPQGRTSEAAPVRFSNECWCDFDARVNRARIAIAAIVERVVKAS